MKFIKYFIFLLLAIPVAVIAQPSGSWPVSYGSSAPSYTPSSSGTRLYFNTATNELYTWQPSPTSSWIKYPKAFDQISGCAAPAYTPTARQSTFAVNSCTPKPELYQYTGSSWACINCYTDYVAGTGIDITGSTISNTGDLSSTNELNTSFSVSGSNLALTDAGGTINVPVSSIAPVQAVSAGTGISISGTTTRAITNTGDLSATNEIQTLSLSGSDLSLSLGGGTVMLPGAAYLYNNGDCDPPGIVPDDQLGPFIAWNQDCEKQWTWNGSAWVLSGSPSGSFFTSSEFTGDGDISTPLTLAQQGATTGQVLRWNGTQWAPGTASGSSGPDSTFAKTNGSYLNKRIGDNVYKNGTLGVRTADTTAVVNILTTEFSKPNIIATGQTSQSLQGFSFQPKGYSGLSSLSGFNITGAYFAGVNLPYSSRPNYVFDIGYNIGSSGQRQNLHEMAFGLGFETYFQNASLSSGITGFQEFHARTVDTLGVESRFISGVFPWQYAKGRGNLGFNIDYLSYSEDMRGGNANVWQWFPLNNNWFINDTTQMYFTEKRGFSLLVQNGAGSSAMSLMQFQNEDTLSVGQSNLPGVKFKTDVIFSRNKIYPDVSSGQLEIGSTTRKSNLVINGSSSTPFIARNGSRAWAWEVSSQSMAIKNETDGKTPMYFYNSMSTGGIILRDNNLGIGIVPSFFPEARLHIYNSSGASSKLIALENSTGRNFVYKSNTTPNAAITANQGDLTVVNDGTNGAFYGKYSGTGNIGWGKFLNLIDPNGASSGQVLTWNGSSWAPATPATITNIYNSNGTFGTFRTGTITDQLTFSKTTDALGGLVPFRLSVGGNDADFQSYVSPANNDSLHIRRIDGKGYGVLSNKNIIVQNTTENVGLEIDATTETTIVSGAIATNSSTQQDVTTTPVNITNGIHTVVLQPGAGTITLPEIGNAAGQAMQGTMLWVTNFSGGTVTINAFSGDQIQQTTSVTLANTKSAWVKSVSAGDWAMITSN